MRIVLVWLGALLVSVAALAASGSISNAAERAPGMATRATALGATLSRWEGVSSPSTLRGALSPTPLRSIHYTGAQLRAIIAKVHQARLSVLYVSMKGMHTRLERVVEATGAHGGAVLTLTYNNLLFSVATKPDSYGTGGDVVRRGTMTLHITGIRRVVTGRWSIVDAHGLTSRAMQFTVHGQYYSATTASLSIPELAQVIGGIQAVRGTR